MTDLSDIRWNRINKARQLIESGFYEDPEIIDDILADVLSRTDRGSLLADLELCPIGDGDAYRDIVADVLIEALDGAVDQVMARREFPIKNGRGDLDLPIRLEGFSQHPILEDWRRRFGMCDILVEVKNEAATATVEDVRQIRCYVEDAGLGHVGMLVCRSGFGQRAIQDLRDVAKSDKMLILPIEHEDLHGLMRIKPKQLSTFLYRKELQLRQAA